MERIIIKLEQEDIKRRIDIVLEEKLNKTRSAIKNMITNNLVIVDGKNVKAGYIIKGREIVEIEQVEPKVISAKPQNIPIDIIYEDEYLAVVNKPQGMVVHPACGNYDGTLVNALMFKMKNLSSINGTIRPGIVHRLDKNTSGLLMIAKTDIAHNSLQQQIQNKTCKRHYLALLSGNLKDEDGIIQTLMARDKKDRKKMCVVSEDGKLATTTYHVVERFDKYTLVEFELKTGRTHQIRVHSKYIGHPVVGDNIYGKESKAFSLNGQLLHAYKIEFIHPITNQKMQFSVPLPNYFENILLILRKQKLN